MKKQHISPLFVAVWIIICAVVSFSLLQHVKSISNATSRLALMEKQTQELEKKNESIRAQIEDARSPFIREKMIRDQLGMQKPGEVVVQIVDTTNVSQSSTLLGSQLEDQRGVQKSSNIERFWQFLGNLVQGIKKKFIGLF